MTSYYPRAIGPRLCEALDDLPVVVVTGLRQTGKSTLLQCEPGLAERRYLSLDDFVQLEAARRDPDTFVQQDEPLTVDEVQKCPELLTAIKRVVDRQRRPGRFLLSGSANFALLQGIAESLAGRALYLTLHPFIRRELPGQATAPPVLKQWFDDGRPPRSSPTVPVTPQELLTGGLPPVCLGLVRRPALWFKGYEQTYLERDVRDLGRVSDLVSFRQLLHLVALRTGQLLNVSELARDAKLSAATTSRYLSLLEASFVLWSLRPYLANRASRLIKSPKLYLADAGLAAYLQGVTTLDLGTALAAGALLETYIAQNLLGLLETGWPEAQLAFWHIQGRHEVDFVIEVGSECLAIEVKRAARWDERDLSGLRAFLASTPHCRAAILAYGGTETVSLGERLWATPHGVILG